MIPWGNQIPIIMVRTGECGVHLAAAALFLLIFSDRLPGSKGSGNSIFRIIGFVGWSIAATLILIISRAGFLAIMLPIAFVSAVRVRTIGWRVAALGIATTTLAIALLSSDLITFKVHHRPFSSEQVISNVSSILGSGSSNATRNTQDTKEFRLVWWGKIIRYTVFGQYRWTGKGFGINLAQVDGPPGMSKEETSLRSPHNGNMTILARMGIPGIAIWAALNFVFVFQLIRAYLIASRAGSKFWSGVNIWILSYWLSAVINMSFDVYIEGPMGGILFWTIIGFGVAAMRIQRFETRQVRAQLLRAAPQAEELDSAAVPA